MAREVAALTVYSHAAMLEWYRRDGLSRVLLWAFHNMTRMGIATFYDYNRLLEAFEAKAKPIVGKKRKADEISV